MRAALAARCAAIVAATAPEWGPLLALARGTAATDALPAASAAARLATTTDDLQEVLNEELVAVSSCFEELFGYSRHELKGKAGEPSMEITLDIIHV